MEICKKVGEVREKISDKKSKYWISSDDKRRESNQSNRKMNGSSRFSINEFKNSVMNSNKKKGQV